MPVRLVFLPDARRLKDLLLGIGYPPRVAREVARRQDPAANFLEAFGRSEAEFEERLRGVVGP